MSKRYYWIKLKQDFYQSNDAIDLLMTQGDGHGAEYVVLYQMLCLKAINNSGGLYSQIGEMIVPYDVEKITRDCKYFERYIVTQALQLYKTLGLVYEQKDSGYLVISDFESLIGGECDSAKRVRKHRAKEKVLHCNDMVTQNVTTDIEKDIEADIEKEKDIEPPNGGNTYEQESFCKTYKIIADAVPPPEIDFSKISIAYSQSSLLRDENKPHFRKMSWIIKNYAKITDGTTFIDRAKGGKLIKPPPEYIFDYKVGDD